MSTLVGVSWTWPKLFAIAPVFLSFVLAPLWPAYGEACARGDSAWVRRTLIRSIVLGAITVIPPAILLVIFGKPIVYVEFVATAPWNRPELQNPPRYRGVGTVMVAPAVELSWDLGYRGRIGHGPARSGRRHRRTCRAQGPSC